MTRKQTHVDSDAVTAASDRARDWARENVPTVYYYSSAASWHGAARSAGVITRAEYDAIELSYGETWWHTGD